MKLLGFSFLSLQCSELCSEVNLLEGLLILCRAGSGTGGVCHDGEGPLDAGAAHCSVGGNVIGICLLPHSENSGKLNFVETAPEHPAQSETSWFP